MIKVAAVQMDVSIGEIARNAATINDGLAQAAASGAKLVVFPECALSGYCFRSLEEARSAAKETTAKEFKPVFDLCAELDVYTVIGFLQLFNGNVYNAAALIGPSGLIGVYRKTHLPILGVDKLVTPGDALQVYETPLGNIGMIICYDLRFPEAARTLALRGADIVCLPTNWPEGAQSSADHIATTRAWENRVFLIACNRVGEERGFRFIGRSRIISPDGVVLAAAETRTEQMVYAHIEPAKARDKRVVVIPSEYEMDPIGHRRPEVYET